MHAITVNIMATFSILRFRVCKIITFLVVAFLTAVLVYFHPVFEEKGGRLLFTITLVWPSGIVIVLVPIIVELVREVNENKVAFVCDHLTKEVCRRFADDSDTKDRFITHIRVNDELRSKDKAKRKEALKIIVDEINRELQRKNIR